MTSVPPVSELPLTHLPHELLAAIASYASRSELVVLLRVNSVFRSLCAKFLYTIIPVCVTNTRGIHHHAPLHNPVYAQHIQGLDVYTNVKACCKISACVLAGLRGLRVSEHPHLHHHNDDPISWCKSDIDPQTVVLVPPVHWRVSSLDFQTWLGDRRLIVLLSHMFVAKELFDSLPKNISSYTIGLGCLLGDARAVDDLSLHSDLQALPTLDR